MQIRFNQLLLDLEIPGHRHTLHSELDEVADAFSREYESMTPDFDLDEFWNDIQKIHDLISAKDYKALETVTFTDNNVYMEWTHTFEVVEKDLHEVLIENGYEVVKSDASSSLYVKLDGKEIRISDHKRPGYSAEGSIGTILEHEYDAQLIKEDNEFTKTELEELGLEVKSDKTVFYM